MSQAIPSIPDFIDTAIVGAGPHGLTLLTHLLQKNKKMRRKMLVFDPSGSWMTRWQEQFAALEIPHLRSPAVHHPDPDPFALRRFAASRPSELYPPYDLPGTLLFQEFCQDVVQRWQLQNSVRQATVVRIEPLLNHPYRHLRLWFEDGRSLVARRVVLAKGSRQINLPKWLDRVPVQIWRDRLCHSSQVDLRKLQLAGERVLIVGGGLTSGHLALGAMDRGANVVLMYRRQFSEKLFDADPGWLGPKYLKNFWAEFDWHNRWQMIQQARDGGSMTPAIMTQLRRAHHSAKLEFFEHCQVVDAQWQGQNWQVCCDDGTSHQFERIWIATGNQLDATTEPLLSEVQSVHPVTIVNGLPVLDSYLRWAGCELFVMGGLAALQVGPTARNLSGARMASDRIVPALAKARMASDRIRRHN